ncbi:helix-turn-helix domain-containing protein [Tellurirhabdus bombi]|uniref:helix-turn-helix domain-containing protein n=1 Tax=Tellurirhabdus bombi TaxID=2907205 RepID=UPI001F29CD85|nr:AraC family transcriptional regulator [Tellurirhabdus bombi]
MIKCIQHRAIEVSNFSVSSWSLPEHSHNHFELTFIHKGSGMHRLNGINSPYGAGNLFLLGPTDYHFFEIREETEFTVLKFINVYLKGVASVQVQTAWNHYIDSFLLQAVTKDHSITEPCFNKETMEQLMRLINRAWSASKSDNDELIFFLTHAVLSLIKKQLMADNADHYQEKITAIVHYIHANIYNPSSIQIGNLAEKFHLSATYLGDYFREKMGVSLRDYIARYRLSLVETRLTHGDFTVKEIASELGFSDLSHLTNFFQKHKGMSPSLYRKQIKLGQKDRNTNTH